MGSRPLCGSGFGSELISSHELLLSCCFLLRHAGVVEISVHSFCAQVHGSHGDYAVFLSHDLSMLRLFEAFSESAPQLVLMLTILLQRGDLSAVTGAARSHSLPAPHSSSSSNRCSSSSVLKAVGSASAIAVSVTMYHRSLRSFLPDKQKQSAASSLVYFLWNLTLIAARLTALALFASLLPCFILAHFFCSWLVLLFCVWRSQTDFMGSRGGEWLYRATVGLVWYFDWLNVVEGRTRFRTLLYHGYMLADISLLCALWCWRMLSADSERPHFQLSQSHAIITAVAVVMGYVLGLLLKMAYYKWFHPNILKEELKGGEEDPAGQERDETDSKKEASPVLLKGLELDVVCCTGPAPPALERKPCNKRMKMLAENFYTSWVM